MLPKHLRLPARMIPLIAYRGKKLQGQYLDIRAAYDDTAKGALFAVTVTTKVSKNAVVRNFLRRKLHVIIQGLDAAGKVRRGRYLVLAKPFTGEINEAALTAELQQAITC